MVTSGVWFTSVRKTELWEWWKRGESNFHSFQRHDLESRRATVRHPELGGEHHLVGLLRLHRS